MSNDFYNNNPEVVNRKLSYIKTNCPDSCYYNVCKSNKGKCNKNNRKCILYTGKNAKVCEKKNKNCINAKKKRLDDIIRGQCQISILSNDQSTLDIRNNVCSRMNLDKVGKKPVYNPNKKQYYCSKKCPIDEQKFYNKIFDRAKWTFYTNFITNKQKLYRYYNNPKNSNLLTKQQLNNANYKTTMWLRSFAAAQGPTVDGWPATSLVGDNNNKLFYNKKYLANVSLIYRHTKYVINKYPKTYKKYLSACIKRTYKKILNQPKKLLRTLLLKCKKNNCNVSR